jgi:hypothetical protein
MHANILQYQHYLDKHNQRRDLNRTILLTANEGLSQQDLCEFETAGNGVASVHIPQASAVAVVSAHAPSSARVCPFAGRRRFPLKDHPFCGRGAQKHT